MKRLGLTVCLIGIACFMTGCKMTDYKDAVKEQEAGNYEYAAEKFNEIKDYKDSADRYELCMAGADFEEVKKEAESKNRELDESIQEASQLVQNQEKALDETLYPALETAISTTKSEKVEIPSIPENTAQIRTEIEQLEKIDYTKVLGELEKCKAKLENSIKKYKLVDHPSEKFILKRLKKVKHVKDISAVTEDNDPNEHLNKAGGYTSDVFFTCDLVNQGAVSGNTVIDKGTDAGGSIEVYATEEDAERRNDYLATFDGTILSGGSHTVVGTVVIRTSNRMTATQQKKMEKSIIKSLTKIE